MTITQSSIKTGNWLFVRRGWLPIFVYIPATLALLFASPESIFNWSSAMGIVCLGVSLVGIGIRSLVIGFTPKNTSGRNTTEGQVADTLNTKGMYSIVRHPLYIGNFMMWLGLILYVGVDWFIPLIVIAYWWYYEKIVMAEEDFLLRKFGTPYQEWCDRTNAFLPKFSHWEKPELGFSFRNVIKREYHGFFYLTLSFLYISVLRNFALGSEELMNRFWLYLFLAVAVCSLIIRIIVKRSKVLDLEGR